jgi:hypothetical protein
MTGQIGGLKATGSVMGCSPQKLDLEDDKLTEEVWEACYG